MRASWRIIWGMDEREYMERLPVKQIRELHYTGLQWLDGG